MKTALIATAALLLCSTATHAQAPRSRAEAQAFCYDVIRYTAGGGTDQRYRMCMFDLGYPVAKADDNPVAKAGKK